MEAQSVVVIHDASRDINLRFFQWALSGLLLMPGDVLTLIVVLHQVITPMGYKSSVDSRLMFGANQKIVERQAAMKKEEYLKNKELAQIFKLYKSKKIGFKIEMATGSSPKAVALKSAIKLKATWIVLDRKMKSDEEYFLQKLSCGILRIRRYNRIIRLRGPLHLPQETQPDSTRETYPDSIPLPDTSTEHDLDLFNIEISPNSTATKNLMIGPGKDHQMNLEQEQGQKSLSDEVGCSTPHQLSTDENNISSKQFVCQVKGDKQLRDKQQIEIRHHGEEGDQKLKQNFKEKSGDVTCGGSTRDTKQESSSTEEYQKSGKDSSFGGARNFYLAGFEEYTVCEHIFSLSNFHLRN